MIFTVIYNILSLPEAAEGIARLEAQLKELKDRVEEREEDGLAKIMARLDECEWFLIFTFVCYCAFQ